MITKQELSGRLLDSYRSLRSLADSVQRGEPYRETRFHRPSGRDRVIFAPYEPLMFVLKKTNEFLRTVAPTPPPYVHGFVRGRSPKTNASMHVAKPGVLRMDLLDFFPSISSSAVRQAMEVIGFDEEATSLATDLTTAASQLPVGFPTSPLISNVVFTETDIALAKWSDQNGLTFTRYADDLTFSGEPRRDHISEIAEVLEAHGWVVNPDKTRLMRRGGKQYVTGLSVSSPEGPKIPARYKHRLRFKLYIIEKHGYETYWTKFGGEDERDTPRRLIGMARHIAGVEPHLGGMFLRRLDSAIDWDPYRDDDAWEDWIDSIW